VALLRVAQIFFYFQPRYLANYNDMWQSHML